MSDDIMRRWRGKDPLEVIEILEARLADRNQTIQTLNGHQGTSDRAKRQRRTARRQEDRVADRRLLDRLEEFLRYEQTEIDEDLDTAGEEELRQYGKDLAAQIAKAWEMIRTHLGDSAPTETTQDLSTPVGDGLLVKPLGHTTPAERANDGIGFMSPVTCGICGEEEEAKIHTDTELHPIDAEDGLFLHAWVGPEPAKDKEREFHRQQEYDNGEEGM